jgi:solute carrier family 25 (mitochondrial dicarboxylate transporter), member 10
MRLIHVGVRSLWSGLSASILRQSTYSTARFGLYNYMAREMKRAFGQKQLSSSGTIMCAGLAGGAAGLLGNPTEVAIQSGRQIEFC